MEPYGLETYGEAVADVYDSWHTAPPTGPISETLAELAAGGRVLELGIGTGRVALPIAAQGLDVHGIDSSPAMVEQLRTKLGGADIPVTIGDFADVDVDGEFSLVFVAFNTFFMLATQAEQVRCFRNVHAHLAPGGRFVIEGFVPDVSRYVNDQNLSVRDIDVDGMRIDASVYDPVEQRVVATQMRITESGIRMVHTRLRFAYPPELDLMGQLAGFELEARWGSYRREPFCADHAFAISVFRRP